MSSNFHLFVALAILEKHRDVMMEHLKHFDEVLKYGKPVDHLGLETNDTEIAIVNELSNTIDLHSTLLRAQALFRRFQRTVEAVDKRNNFPTPSVRQRKPVDKPASSKPTSPNTASGVDGRRRPNSSSSPTDKGKAKEQVISPELRQLLSRKVEVLDKKDVAEHGGGVGA